MNPPNLFLQENTDILLSRINQLHPTSPRSWGVMDVAQMLAHCNITYEMVYTEKHPKPSFFTKLILKALVKKKVVDVAPYKPNLRTGPPFIIRGQKNFEEEKQRLIEFIEKTLALGESFFEGKESHSFGPLTAKEWNNMFYKHLDHHLRQFGV